MNSKNFIILLLLSAISIQFAASFLQFILLAIQAIQFVKDTVDTLSQINRLSAKYSFSDAMALATNDKGFLKVLDAKIDEISNKVAAIESTFTSKIDKIIEALKNLPLQNLYIDVKNDVIQCHRQINEMYRKAVSLSNSLMDGQVGSLTRHLIDTLVNYGREQLFGQISQIRAVIGPNFPGILMQSFPSLLSVQLQTLESTHCGPLTLQFKNFELFGQMIHTEYKALMAGLIGLQLWSMQKKMNSTWEMERLRTEFLSAYYNYYEIFKGASKNTSTAIRSCHEHFYPPDIMWEKALLSLDLIASDYKKNKVITGIKFITLGGMHTIAITEAELLPHGEVKNTTLEWKNNGKFYGDHVNLIQMRNPKYILNFDDIKLPKNYVLTGLQFQFSGKKDASGYDRAVELKLFGTPFDFFTGKLDPQGTREFTTSNISHVSEVPLTFAGSSDITYCAQPRQPNSGINEFARFVSTTHSDKKYVTPLFVTAEAASEPRVALAGAGIFIKTYQGCESLVDLRVFTIDYAEYFAEIHENIIQVTQAKGLRKKFNY